MITLLADEVVRMAGTHPSTPTAQTSVRSPLCLSVLIRSPMRPLATSHLRRLLSEHPATIHKSDHSSSSSSSELSASFIASPFVSFGIGGPHARLRIRLLARSSLLKWVSVSCSSDSNRTAPSSQPMARIVDAGLGAIHQIDPPCDGRVRLGRYQSLHKRVQTCTHPYTWMFKVPFSKFTAATSTE